ncbi:GGDEF domain-containing protein [Alicyclobacillus pomorum]|uniref:GGDEF domain-containing protein n=1 Tax=Alicyclobacillus pomorum TaxID=204470 RepID=UPI0003F7C282|nr:GGDEF domain-containing protein [Alicyclobacillus pomorum]
MDFAHRVVLKLLKLSEHKVVLATVLFGVIGEFVMLSNHMDVQAALNGAAILLITVAVSMPQRARWTSVLLLGMAACVLAAWTWVQPEFVLSTLVISAVAGSFISVRVKPQLGLAFFFVELAVSAEPMYRMLHDQFPLLMVVMVGGSVVLALQVYEVSVKFHQYRRLSIYDELTGLHNARYFRHKLNEYYNHWKVNSLCLLLFDLDRFKLVNDTLGHRAGDEVLKRAAQILQEHASPAVVSRYGGEEFAVMLPNASEAEARELAEKLRVVLESTVLCGVPVTLSCGIVYCENRSVGPDELFDAADRALYEAKKMRNCVCVYSGGHANHQAAATVDPVH